jgi:NAD(P)H dehydrogenase (quinone)
VTDAIGVVGAAGNTGRALLGALSGAGGQRARALVHRAENRAAVTAAGATDVAVVELADAESLTEGFAGLSAVYMMSPLFSADEVDYVSNALTAAARAGVRRFVYHSVLHPYTPAMRHHQRKAAAEVLVRSAELEWVILQPAMYAETLVTMLERAGNADEIPVPYQLEATFTPVSVRDIADVAVQALASDELVYGSFELAGPQMLTVRSMIATMAEVSGRPLEPRQVKLTSGAMPPKWGPSSVADAIAMWAEYDAHGLLGNALTLRTLLDHEPTTFAEAVAARLVPA